MSLTLVESGALADLLGAAEGPAHADWSKDTQKFKRTYGNAVKAAKLVPIVRGVADKIVQLISSQSGSFDNRILSQFFKMPEKPGGDDGKVIDPPPPPPPPRSWKRAAPRPGGRAGRPSAAPGRPRSGRSSGDLRGFRVEPGMTVSSLSAWWVNTSSFIASRRTRM